MAQYEVPKGKIYVAANGVTYTPGQIVEVDDSKMDIGDNLQKPTRKALKSAASEPDQPTPLFPAQA